MTSKQRAYLKGLAMSMDTILQMGKSEPYTGAYPVCKRGAGRP